MEQEYHDKLHRLLSEGSSMLLHRQRDDFTDIISRNPSQLSWKQRNYINAVYEKVFGDDVDVNTIPGWASLDRNVNGHRIKLSDNKTAVVLGPAVTLLEAQVICAWLNKARADLETYTRRMSKNDDSSHEEE